jgi:hypothetical protein
MPAPEDVVALDQDVSKVDPDPEQHTPVLRDRASIGNRPPGRVNKPRLIDVGSHGPQRIDRSRLGEG